jgi:hypothetical protein
MSRFKTVSLNRTLIRQVGYARLLDALHRLNRSRNKLQASALGLIGSNPDACFAARFVQLLDIGACDVEAADEAQ